MKRLVLIDGNALLHRAYHATPPLTTSKGELINGVFGFTSMLLRAISDLEPDYIGIAWDEKAPTFRHQAYTQYKATRGPADEGLTMQYKRVHQIVRALNIPEFSLSGYEADDLIGTLAKKAVEAGVDVIIVTGDRDIMQIIDKKIKILMPKKTLSDVGLYGEGEFFLKYGFEPAQMIDYKALAGDASDNIPGVSGIGDVSATKLIKEFGSVEKIYEPGNLKTLPERMQKLLAEGAESAVMSKKLATLDLNAPIKLELEKCAVHDYEHKKAVKLFEELEFKSLIPRLPGNGADIASQPRSLVRQRKRPAASEASDTLSGAAPDRLGLTAFGGSFAHSKETSDLDKKVDKVLKKMSEVGVLVDLKFLEKLGIDLKKRLKKLEKEIYKFVGHEFNLNSPKQLGEVLFDELNLPVVRKTKTGRSTDEATLQELKAAHPAIPLLLEYRILFKLISTYIDALPKYTDKKGRIHSTFNVEGAATGRLSSQNPNLQNIPVKGDLGGEMRKAFIAQKGKVLLSADYSQIELRIMAHLADDPGLKKAFNDGLDIHAATAAKIFKVPIEEVNRQQRMVGKTMNFATLYGQGPRALSQQLGVEYALAKLYIEEYFLQFPKVKEWMRETLEKGYKEGIVQTLWGRIRHIPELQAQNHMIKAAGERMAINMPVQGCLPWSTKVLTNEGYIPIGELYEQTDSRPLYIWDGNSWQGYKVLNRGKAELAEITFSNGQTLQCDTRHIVLTVDHKGYHWTSFSDLKPGTKVCFSLPLAHQFSKQKSFDFEHKPAVGNGKALKLTSLPENTWYWVGYYYGDGHLTNIPKEYRYNLQYTFGLHEYEKKQECCNFFIYLGLNPMTRYLTAQMPSGNVGSKEEVKIYSLAAVKLFEKLGVVANQTAHTKRLPQQLFRETFQNRAAFIRGFLDSDGYMGNTTRSVPNIHLCQRSLLEDLQLLLRTLGIESRICGPYHYKAEFSYRLDIKRRDLAKIVSSLERAAYTRDNQHSIPHFLKVLVQETYPDLTAKSFQTKSDYIIYRRLLKNDSSSIYHFQEWLERNNLQLPVPLYTWHEVVETKRTGIEETTYTLSVHSLLHRFDSEGVISKNTAADMIKKAMVDIDKSIVNGLWLIVNRKKSKKSINNKLQAKRTTNQAACQLILQVHDELLFECNGSVNSPQVQKVAKMIKEKMEKALELSVPVVVDLKAGKNWGEMEKLEI